MNDELIMTLMTHMKDASKPERKLIKLYVEALERMNNTQRAELTKLTEMANGLSEVDRQDFMGNIVAYAWRVVDGETAAQIMASSFTLTSVCSVILSINTSCSYEVKPL